MKALSQKVGKDHAQDHAESIQNHPWSLLSALLGGGLPRLHFFGVPGRPRRHDWTRRRGYRVGTRLRIGTASISVSGRVASASLFLGHLFPLPLSLSQCPSPPKRSTITAPLSPIRPDHRLPLQTCTLLLPRGLCLAVTWDPYQTTLAASSAILWGLDIFQMVADRVATTVSE